LNDAKLLAPDKGAAKINLRSPSAGKSSKVSALREADKQDSEAQSVFMISKMPQPQIKLRAAAESTIYGKSSGSFS